MRIEHFLLVFLFLGGLTAQEDTLSWTTDYSMNFKQISSVTISPEGNHIAYVVIEPIMEGEKSEYLTHIWVANADGSESIQYTRGEKSCTSPKFSPDGKYLAFLSSRDTDEDQIWMIRLMGGEAEQITAEENSISSFEWAPDGQSFAFVKKDPDSEEETTAKDEKRYVIEVDRNYKHAHLYTVNLVEDEEGNRTVKRLTNGDFSITDFDWSPDGKSIVFGHKKNPKINTSRLDGDIAVVPADSGAVSQLVTGPGVETNPKYSPDGKWIAYQSTGDQPEPIGLNDFYLISAKGGSPKALPHTPNRSSSFLGWSDDGMQLLLSEPHRTSVVAMSMPVKNASTDDIKILSPTEGTSSSIDISTDNNLMAYVYQTPDRPAEVYLRDMKTRKTNSISKVNADVKLPEMAKTEVITWKSKDGLDIEGILTYPLGYEKGKKYPVILQIHGGPAGVFTESFTGNPSIYNTQFFAENGFAIIRPNPRGSTGYGKDFRYANFMD